MNYQDELDSRGLARYAAWLNARARAVGAEGRLDVTLLRDRILESGGRCEWCDVNIVDLPFELDHIVSLKRGGSNAPSNLGVACTPCNRRKAKKSPVQFAAEIYNLTGIETRLVALLLHARGGAAIRQIAMFEEARVPENECLINVNDDLAPVPHYDWTD